MKGQYLIESLKGSLSIRFAKELSLSDEFRAGLFRGASRTGKPLLSSQLCAM
jgi:hypothetical protein